MNDGGEVRCRRLRFELLDHGLIKVARMQQDLKGKLTLSNVKVHGNNERSKRLMDR